MRTRWKAATALLLLAVMIAGGAAQDTLSNSYTIDTENEWQNGTLTDSTSSKSPGELELIYGKNSNGYHNIYLEIDGVLWNYDTALEKKVKINDGSSVTIGELGGTGDIEGDSMEEVFFHDSNDNLKYYNPSTREVTDTGVNVLRLGGVDDPDGDNELEVAIYNGNNFGYYDINDQSLITFDAYDCPGYSVGYFGDWDDDSGIDLAFSKQAGECGSFVDGLVWDFGSSSSTELGSYEEMAGFYDVDDDGRTEALGKLHNDPAVYGHDSSGDSNDLGIDTYSSGPVGQVENYDDSGGADIPYGNNGLQIYDLGLQSSKTLYSGEAPGYIGATSDIGYSNSGSYISPIISYSEKQSWKNISVSGLSRPNGAGVEVTVETSNDNFSTVNESQTLTNSSLSEGSNTYTLDSLDTKNKYARIKIDYQRGDYDTPSIEAVELNSERGNQPPKISQVEFKEDRSGSSTLTFDLDDRVESDIAQLNGVSNPDTFTNQTWQKSGVDLPFTASVNVSDFNGLVSSNVSVDVDSSAGSLAEQSTFSHQLGSQRIYRDFLVSNNGDRAVNYSLYVEQLGASIVQGDPVNENISAGAQSTLTGVWEGDWITGEVESPFVKGQNRSLQSSLSEQHIYNQTRLVAENTRNFSFSDVDLSSICSSTASADVPSGESTVTESCSNESYSGDWISDVSTYTIEQGQNSSAVSTIDQQYLADQTGLKANSSLGFELPEVDVSSQCEDAETASVPSGFNNVTESCSVDSEQGDWILNEEVYSTEYSSETVVYGGGIQDAYTTVQNIYAENQRTDLDLDINFTEQIEDIEGCSLDGSAEKTIPAITGANKSFYQSCNPGKEIGYIPVQKTATGDKTKHNLTTKVQVFTNLTDEQSQWIGIPKDRLDNFEDRNAGETEAFVNGRDTDVSVEQGVENGTEYVFIIVGDEYGDSSLHAGNHTASLIYYQGGTEDSDSGTGSASPGQVIDEVEGEDYSWTLSNPQSEDSAGSGIQAIPGREFERRLVVENQGDNPVTLDLQCISESNSCDWVAVSVDRIELEAGEGSTQTFQVRGQVPESATPEDTFRFSVRVSDPSFDESTPSTAGSADADYVVNINPFLGSVITGVDKILSLREISPPWDGAAPIPYPFVFIPLFGGGSVFAGLGKAMGMAGFDRSESALVSFFVGFAVFIVVTLVA